MSPSGLGDILFLQLSSVPPEAVIYLKSGVTSCIWRDNGQRVGLCQGIDFPLVPTVQGV